MSGSSQRYHGMYRTESNRLKGWDYRSPGFYFVTICTQARIHWFGKIESGNIFLSPIGEIIRHELENTSEVRPNVKIDIYSIMPNHIHMINVINEMPEVSVETSRRDVSTQATQTRYLQSGSVGAIVNQFKSICTKRIRRAGYNDFTWQARFYDHIIHNEKELDAIRAYILGNPIIWAEDEYYSD